MLITIVIAMVVAALLVPGMLILLRRSADLVATHADNDEGLAARAELAELFGSVDPIGDCASPSGGAEAAYRDKCFREIHRAGASLIGAPDLPAASPQYDHDADLNTPTIGYGACWLTTNPDNPTQRQRRCIVLEGDSDQPECSDSPTGPCLRVRSNASEADGEPVLVDRHGGGLLLVRTWDEDITCTSGVPFLPPTDCFTLHSGPAGPDRLIYTDVEWWCMRWRSPTGGGGVTPWKGACPAPADPCERIPDDPGTPQREEWNPAWSVATATWTASTPCQPDAPALPVPARYAVADPDVNGDGIIDGPPHIGTRITDVELLVCVASDRTDRLQGKPHCAVDRMRLSVADAFGTLPPAPRLAVDAAIALDGLTVLEGSKGSFSLRLGLQPSVEVTVTVTITDNAPPGVSVAPPTLKFTPDNWNEQQLVTVTVTDDDTTEVAEQHFTVTLTATTPTDPDSNYDGVAVEVQVIVPPSDHPALTVDPRSVTVAENGTAEFAVRLEAPPIFLVTVTVTSDNAAVATVNHSSLTFTTTDWETSQTVTVTGTDDADISDASTTVTLDPSSVGNDYNGLEDEAVEVTVIDDDEPALLVSPTYVTVDENGSETFDMSLTTLPSGSVTVSLMVADSAVATVTPATLTFTTSDWNTVQSVTVTGTDDPDSGTNNTTITATATNGGYSSTTAQITVSVTDDDLPPRFSAADAAAYVAARDALVDESKNGASFLFGTRQYVTNYRDGASYYRSRNNLDPDIPLGEDEDPNSLPDPTTLAGQQELRDAIDALAVAAGLPQWMIDAAENG